MCRVIASVTCEGVGVSVLSLTRQRCRRLQSRTRARVNKCHSLREHDVKTLRWGATRRIYRTNRHVNVATRDIAIGMLP